MFFPYAEDIATQLSTECTGAGSGFMAGDRHGLPAGPGFWQADAQVIGAPHGGILL
jgi:hypothetical protein